jgi:WD40 repeat protein
LQVDGSKLAAGLGDGAVVVWNEDGTKSFEWKESSGWVFSIMMELSLHNRSVNSISWNGVEEMGHLFVTGGYDGVNNLQFE